MGVADEEDVERENHEFLQSLKRVLRRATNRIFNPLWWFDGIFRITEQGRIFFKNLHNLNEYSDRIIRKRIDEFRDDSIVEKKNSREPRIFLDILLQHYRARMEPFLDEKVMRSEVNTFILGGYDTTATALISATILLGHHVECQEIARREIEAIRDSGEDPGRRWTITDLKQMKYLEMCIKETLRIFPSAMVISRRLLEPLQFKCNKNLTTLPAGSECVIPIFLLHRDPEQFPEPERFDPERFRNGKHHPFGFIPFSAGLRNCIGQKYAFLEMKYTLASLLLKFRIRSITNQEDLCPELAPLFKPCNNISIILEKLK